MSPNIVPATAEIRESVEMVETRLDDTRGTSIGGEE